jgi:hypothetical protein
MLGGHALQQVNGENEHGSQSVPSMKSAKHAKKGGQGRRWEAPFKWWRQGRGTKSVAIEEHPCYGHGPHRLWAPDLFRIATGLTARPARKATGRYPNDNPLASLSRPPSYMSRHVHMSKKIHMFRVNKSHRNVIPLLADYHKPHHLVPTKSIAQLACWPSSAPPRQPSFWTLGITPPYLPRLQDFIQCLQYQAYWSC